MSLIEGATGLSASDIALLSGKGNGDNDGFGGGNSAFLILILVLFAAMCGGGWGNNNRGGGGNSAADWAPLMMASTLTPAASTTINNDVQRGFDQQSIMAGLGGISSAISTGFANAEISRCNAQGNILQALWNNQLGLQQTLNQNQSATTAAMNQLAMSLQQCCCDNRQATSDLRATIISENCADRQAINTGVRDIIANQTNNTTSITNAITSGIQSIKDDLCQDRLDAKDAQIQALQNQLNMANIREQTGQLINDNSNQTAKIIQDLTDKVQALAQLISPRVQPAYIVPNPNTGCCGTQANYGCCG